jgi:hypothetical protein
MARQVRHQTTETKEETKMNNKQFVFICIGAAIFGSGITSFIWENFVLDHKVPWLPCGYCFAVLLYYVTGKFIKL